MVDNNQEVFRCYTVEYDDNGKLASILVEEGKYDRRLYKRNPQGMELLLSDEIFEETVEAFLDNEFFDANDMYIKLRAHDEYYANLMKKEYKKYLQKYVLGSSLHRDAFWGD